MAMLSKIFALFALLLIGSSTALPVAFADQIFTPTASQSDFDRDLNARGKNYGGVEKASELNGSFISAIEGSMTSTFGNTFRYIRAWDTGERGAFGLLVTIARDLKNVAVAVAIVYLVISSLRILTSGGDDEGVKKWKSTIAGVGMAIIIMQSAFVLIDTLYNRNVGAYGAMLFLDKIVYPFVHLIEMLASFAFLATAFIAFYRIVTAWGDEEAAKKGKKSIILAIAGFLLLKIPGPLVKSIYGQATCDEPLIFSVCRIKDPQISDSISIFTTFVNYVNGFLALVILLLIIYAGWLVIMGGGNEENVKRAKKIVLYIVIGTLLLVSSYILFNFFVVK